MQRVPQLKRAVSFEAALFLWLFIAKTINGALGACEMNKLNEAIASKDSREFGKAEFQLTSSSLITVDYIAPPASVSDYVTTLYHFRCDEEEIRDIQPASIGHLSLFPFGKGKMIFRGGNRDSNPEIAILTPLSTATPIYVRGPFHVIGAALTPLGWAALTGMHAGENRDRLLEAEGILGSEITALGERLNTEYRLGTMGGHDCALALGEYIERAVKPVNARHVELIRRVNTWLGSSLNPDLADLVVQAAYSQRQVQRLTERYFGLPPQKLARKYRALRAAALMSFPQLTPEFEAELAEAFFDQSHMIREINLFAGRTPARLNDDDTPFLSEMLDPKNFRELGL